MLPMTGRVGERGQSLPLLALSLVALMALVGFAIDVGRIYATRTELTRSLDAGALAGVQELPDMTKAKAVAENYVYYNEPTAINIVAAQEGSSSRLRVTASKTVSMTFLKVIGVGDITVTQQAVAGLGTVPMDVVMALDVTGSMRWDCVNGKSGQTSDCKITEARNAANALNDILLTGGYANSTALGLAPFTDGYAPPAGPHASVAGYTSASAVQALTSSNATMRGKINALTANGGTNICTGLLKAQSVMFGAGSRPGPGTMRAIVLMTDGGNSWTDSSTDAACRVNPNSNPWGYADTAYSGECFPDVGTGAQTAAGGQMDIKTQAMANALKAQNVELYVVAVGVCGPQNTNLCNTAKIGTIPDSDRTHNLLKCAASSTPGTNDHYFETNDATELTTIFQNIARLLALRLLE